MSIVAFKCADTQGVFEGKSSRKFAPVKSVLERKLLQLDGAAALKDLASPPSNNLEALVGRRDGQHSIRVNDKWRLCFVWTTQGPSDVECVDYHDERK